MNAYEHTIADQKYAMYCTEGFTFTADERLRDAWTDGVVRVVPHYRMVGGGAEPTGEAEYVYSDGSVLVVRVLVGVGGSACADVGEYVDIEDDDEDDYELLESKV